MGDGEGLGFGVGVGTTVTWFTTSTISMGRTVYTGTSAKQMTAATSKINVARINCSGFTVIPLSSASLKTR